MTFGEYFRKLRVKKSKTQKDIAACIGKTTMLVSGVEKGKNGPFSTEDLKYIARYLELSKEEEEELLIEASAERGSIPDHLIAYMRKYRKSYELIAILKEKKYNNNDISELMKKLEE